MGKKKAIKLATATAIAASAFVAVAPTQSEAATSSVDKAITKASSAMLKAFNTYNKTARVEGKLPALATIKKDVKSAQDAYTAAAKEIASKGGTKAQKATLTKKLDTNKKYLDRAELYLKAVTTNLKPTKEAFTAAVAGGTQSKVLSAQKAYQAKIKEFEANVKKVYGPDARELLTAKYADAANELVNSVNEEMTVYTAYKEISVLVGEDLEAAYKGIQGVEKEAANVAKLDTKLAKNINSAVVKINDKFEKAVKSAVSIEGITDGEKTEEETKTITVKATKGSEIKVTLNGTAVAANENGSYTLKLQEGSNKVAVESTVYGVKTELNQEITSNQTPAVKSVSAINATQVEVTFNKAVDAKSVFADGVSGTFKTGVLSIRSIDSLSDGTLSGVLSQDGKVLTVTSTVFFEKRYDVVIDKVTAGGKDVEKYSKIISIDKDVTAPSIVGTERITANQIKVKFSEPMSSAGSTTFKLADGTTVTGITGQGTLVDGGKAVILDLSNASVPASKDITAAIIGAADKAGNLLTPNPATVTFQKGDKDGVAPTVSSVTQTGAKTFEIKFSEAIVVKPTVAIDNTPVTTANVVIDSKDASTVTVTAGSVLDGDKIVTIAGFVDGSGENGSTTNRVVKFVKDAAAPQLLSSAVVADATDKAEYLEFTFDKNVEITALSTVDVTGGSYVKDHITTTIADGEIVAKKVDYKDSNNKKVIRVELDTLLGSKDVEGANYSVNLTFAGVASEAGEAISTGKATFTRGQDGTLANKDVIALDGAIVQGNNNNEVVVTFDKNVDAATATNPANYIVGGAVVDSATVSSTDLKKVTLKLKANSNTFSGIRNVTVQNVKAAGSTVAMTTETKAVELNENVVPTVSAKLDSDLKTIKLTFSESVYQVADDTLDFGVLVGTEAYTSGTPAVAFEVDSDLGTNTATAANTVDIELPSTVTAAQLTKGLSLKALADLDIKDVAGNSLSVPANITIAQ